MISIDKVKKILEIISLLSRNNGIEDLLSGIINNASKVIDAEAASLLLFDKNKENLFFYIALGEKGEQVKESFSLKKGQGIAGWVALYGEPLIVNDPQNDPRFFSKISEEINYKTRNLLCTPMKIDDNIIGVIEVINKIDGPFTEEDKEILQAFSNQCAILVFNAKIFNDLIKTNIALKDELDKVKDSRKIIGESPIIKDKIKLAEMVAHTESNVLLQGESGTGKELFAELIHYLSPRKNAPFVKVNCAAIPENLLESELFGYKKGAFTGAVKDTMGKIELANNGTLFLDEIGELPLSIQAKLLRFIENKEIQKLGDSNPIPVNVRIISATNKDLPKVIAEKKFREDLYYRINVFPIYLPPLRERKEDIEILANYFLKKYSIETKKKIRGFSEEAIEIIKNYTWPGNVRELENVIERACVLTNSDIINSDVLLLTSIDPKNSFSDIFKEMPLKEAINVFKKEYINYLLNKNNWKQTKVAKILDIQRTYLSRLIKELNINKY
ncbi:MAG: sigma 54-interacting transcriptional regulator [Spirochaetes bacterium]|nr:sigma 54-interacting transcriptional regulator [Spirochaetota bacterium]